MITLLPKNQNIVLKQDTHQYFNKSGEELISISSLLSLYKPKFDEFGHIKRACAKRDGITIEELQQKWDKERDDSCVRGHNLHKHIEIFIKTGQILDEGYKDIVEQFKQIKFTGQLNSEIILADSEYKICGTADIVHELSNKTVDILDFKQNKKMSYKSKYNTKLLYPLDNVDSCEYEIYKYQLNLYSFILSQNGYKTRKMALLYVNPENHKLEIHKIPIIKKDIKKLLKHYIKMRDW